MKEPESLTNASLYVRDLLQEKFGQPLARCDGCIGSYYLVFHIHGFMSEMERVLVAQGQSDAVMHSRRLIMQGILPELRGVLQRELNVQIVEYQTDWSYENNSGFLAFRLWEEVAHSHPPGSWSHLQEFHDEVVRLSTLIEKPPVETSVIPLTPHMLLVRRDGILILLEKTLLAKGYRDELRTAKAELEKAYFQHDAQFQRLIGRELEDVFIDWNLDEDRSLMCFIWR